MAPDFITVLSSVAFSLGVSQEVNSDLKQGNFKAQLALFNISRFLQVYHNIHSLSNIYNLSNIYSTYTTDSVLSSDSSYLLK